MLNPVSTVRTLTLLLCASLAVTAVRLDAADPAPAPDPLIDTAEGRALYVAWVSADYRFTPEVKAAYVAMAKAKAMADLKTSGESVPDDFLAWVDSDPVVESTVYGLKSRPGNMLRILHSLEMDLGRDTVRGRYKQLALAYSVTYAHHAPEYLERLGVSLKPREKPFELVIPENPLKPVDTKNPNRELDVNDHIINFLNDTPLEWEVKVPAKEEGGEPTVEKHSRQLYGCDVIMRKDYQAKFNAYMAAHGHPEVQIDCLSPGPRPHAERAKTMAAGQLFHDAYVAKGLLPAARDPQPTLSEAMAFRVMTDSFRFPEDSKRKWPVFPLDRAPWPALTFQAQYRLPLREVDDMWRRFVETGRPLNGSVQYVGWLAQKTPLHRAKYIRPFDYYYGSPQMMIKDGGVCGAQSTTEVYKRQLMNMPATTTREPAHCGVTTFHYNFDQGVLSFGHSTTPMAWVLKDKPHVGVKYYFHESTALGLNYGLQSQVDSYMGYNLYAMLSDKDRAAHGITLLESIWEINPYNILVNDAFARHEPIEVLRAYKRCDAKIATMVEGKPGCPARVYRIDGQLVGLLRSRPIPENEADAREVYDWVRAQETPDLTLLVRYRAAVQGLDVALELFEKQLEEYLASERTGATSAVMASRFNAAATMFERVDERKAWAQAILGELSGKEVVLQKGYYFWTDPLVGAVARQAGVAPPTQAVMIRPHLDATLAKWRELTAAQKLDPKWMMHYAMCARRIIPAIQDVELREQWRDQMLAALGDRADGRIYQRMIETTGWKVVDVSRQQGRGGLALFAIDANPNTIWHTSNGPDDRGGVPQHVSVDMGEAKVLTGFTFLPRVKVKSGAVEGCAFYTSMDGENWTQATEAKFGPEIYTIPTHDEAERRVKFDPVMARYFKLVVTSVYEGDHLVVTEVGVIETHAPSVVAEATRTAVQGKLDALLEGWRETIAAGHDRKTWLTATIKLRAAIESTENVEQREPFRAELIAAVGDNPAYQVYRRIIRNSGWKVIDVSRNVSREGAAEHAIDGDRTSIWNTALHSRDQGGLPQHIAVDMGVAKTLTGFTVMPRVKVPGGMVTGCAFYTSLDGENWTLATEATLTPDPADADFEAAERSATFSSVKARYFKLVITGVIASNHVAIAEVGVIEAGVGD